ncbi:hypothetical protein GLOIN_2v1576127, partial [Rhizophagus irregularis DAOM 181602=DAOM 197198]
LRSSCLTCDEEYYLMYFFLLSCVVKEDGKIYELMDIVYMDNIYFDGGTVCGEDYYLMYLPLKEMAKVRCVSWWIAYN